MRTARTAERSRRRFKVTLGGGVSFTVDVSPGGFCTETMRVLTPGTMIAGSLEGPGMTVGFTGRVAWAVPGDSSVNLRGRMGVTFARVDSEAFELLLGAGGRETKP
jgi:hypothetical protein